MQTHQQFIKVLKGYGFSVSVKDNKIILKNAIPFQENIPEEYYANNLPYEKIVLCGKGYVSTEAMSLLCEKNCSLVLMNTFGEPIAFVNPVRESFQGSRYRMAQYDTFRISEKREYLAKQIVKSKIQSQIDFLKYTKNESVKGGIVTLSKYLSEVDYSSRPNGIEAKSSAVYFAEYVKLIPTRYEFQGRNQSFLRSSKEQATDLVNGLLNYGYTVLASDISKLINTVGLDAYYGFYHANKSSFQSLVYDMIEPFRWLVDWAVYSLCHEKNTEYPKLNEIAQYYHESLDNAYLHNIGKLPDWYVDAKSNRTHYTRFYYKRFPYKVRKYCIQDCIYTKELANHWIKVFFEAFDFYPQRFISSGYLAEKVLINNKIQIPLFREIPFEINEFAWRSYYGARFEILKRGFIGEAHLYDINSAYPYSLANIPDITKGQWIKSKSLLDKSHLGFFKIKCDIPDDKYIPPFPFRTNGKLIFPTGQFITYCTLAELRAYNEPNHYKILESFQYLDDNPSYPYKEFIESIYNKRLQFKNENNPLQLPLKIILNSIYGKTAQRVGNKIGNLFSPIIASSITGNTRAMLYDFVQKYGIENDVVSFATDSIITTKKLNIDSTKLGDFSYDNSGNDVYVLQNGIYRFNGKWKKRGIGNLGNAKIEHLDTIEKNGQLYQVMKVLRVNRLRTAILSNSINEIGKFKTVERLVNLNADRKRMWFEELRDVNDGKMIDSLPLSMDYFKKIIF